MGSALALGGARAQELAPPSFAVGSAELRLDAEASGALFGPHQPGRDGAQVSGAFLFMPQLRRDYDSGLVLALNGRFAAADPLSRGHYDGDVVEHLTADVRTGLGSLAVGLSDGAADALAVGGPKVDAEVSLDDPRTSFYRDPGTGRAAIDLFALRTQARASSNYAKFLYTSPSLFGAQLAVSFTPSEGKDLPFLHAGPHRPGRQADIWEIALRYETDLETPLGVATLAGYGAAAEGRAEHKLPGQEGVSDLSTGAQASLPLGEDWTVALGGSWRQSNAYGFDINQSFQPAVTRAQHVSAMLSYRDWSAGVEYGNGVARPPLPGLARLGQNGTQASLGYQLSPSMRASGGWQKLDYTRDIGLFFNGARQLKMDAVYLHLTLLTSEQ